MIERKDEKKHKIRSAKPENHQRSLAAFFCFVVQEMTQQELSDFKKAQLRGHLVGSAITLLFPLNLLLRQSAAGSAG